MSNQCGGVAAEQKTAAERIEEARQLNRSICETLTRVLMDLRQGEFGEVKDIAAKQKQLETALMTAQKHEAEFNAKHGTGLGEGDIDFDRVRIEIGCRLGRLRRCCREEGVSA